MQKDRREGFKKRLTDRYGDASLFGNSELIVMRGEKLLTVYGCRRIVKYSPCEICLESTKKRIIHISGVGLFFSCFSAGSITVEGKIRGVCYMNDQK